jgi:hypothetical protein
MGMSKGNGRYSAERLIRNINDPVYMREHREKHNRGVDRRRWVGKYIFIPFMLVVLYFCAKAQWHF